MGTSPAIGKQASCFFSVRVEVGLVWFVVGVGSRDEVKQPEVG